MFVNTAQNSSLMTSPNLSTIDNSNGSNSCSEGVFWEWLYTFQPIYIMMVCITGLVGNIFVLIVICLHKSHCTVPEIYLGNLAGADLLLLACVWAINIFQHFNWFFEEFLCRYVNPMIYMNLYSSVYFLVMVSVDRYLALVKVLRHGRIRTVSCAKINCFFIWLFGLLMSSPVFIFQKVIHIPDLNISACLLDFPHEYGILTMDIILIVIVFLVPAAIISFCTFQILNVLRNNQMQRFKQVHKESKATNLVLIVLLAFVIFWLPFQLITFLSIFYEANLLSGCTWLMLFVNGYPIANCLALTNNCINPILYVIVGKQFRKKARELYVQAVARMEPMSVTPSQPKTHQKSTKS
ncbi:B2 bradykinin receptor-like [Heterodontus francisci]|uniref:B2 bradykinin receptor-like n=1 Tax=Heterodontus francisci TaxID=7792 RepID=UPI00355AE486